MNPVQSNQQINDPGNFTLLSCVAIFLPAWLCFWQLDIKLWPMLQIINWNAISIHGNAAYKRNVTDCFPRKGTNNFVTNPTWGMVHTSTYTSWLCFFSGYYDESIQNLHLNCPTSPSEMWHSSCSRGGTPTGLPVDFKKLTDSQVLLHSIPWQPDRSHSLNLALPHWELVPHAHRAWFFRMSWSTVPIKSKRKLPRKASSASTTEADTHQPKSWRIVASDF